ncbi:lipopolysaccharide heptosyltransferase I [Campylobacter pinnipediorum subsp. caledonicus]|uniref:lipopolysaccharide heptosyltransferase I n=1 Tax=Campylobacter pinnipediorum TaxID=1965231 RepID=UPI0009954F12|nr:lipopolysaccharide heptosyltransferase I [Campylobacter pinnipediorum]OPA71619.1 lipopolysaccharide heptosyltransferase I [Campylobacter pinnipediorum subsp. caledonicus]
MKNKNKIAIVKLSALGDIVHSVIVLQFIKKHIPNSHITWIVDERFADILRDHSLIDELVEIPLKDKKILKCYKILKNLDNFDVVIDMQGLLKSAIVSRIIGKKIYGFGIDSVKENIASLFYKYKLKIDYNENIIIRNLSLVSFALDFKFDKNDIINKNPCFDISPKEKDSKNTIIIAPFASEDNKCYDKFKDVINLLKEYEIYITHANDKELKSAEKLTKNTHAKLLERKNLKEMIKAISQTDLVIGNDSGLTHIAWAVNTPSITLFGNRPSKRNAFKTNVNLVVDMGKQPDAKSINKNDFCIKEILPETVANFAKRILNG